MLKAAAWRFPTVFLILMDGGVNDIGTEEEARQV
jgi:hypothetical protein